MTSAASPHQKPKRYSFYIIAILLPFIILALVEAGLRLSGYGKQLPLFVPAQGIEGYLKPNPDIIQRYFADASIAPNVSPDTVLFNQHKPKDSFRIVVQGGSTAAGFPYGRWASLQGMLDQRFKLLYPDKHIEIINTAMAAVNTYTLLDFVDEIIAIEPDLIMIYTGHNEYVGIMGIGSAFAAKGGNATTLLYLKLKSLKLYQWVESIYFHVFTSLNNTQDDKNANKRSLMSKVAQEKNIPIDSPLYQAGIAQFTNNLSLILSEYKQADVPVLISTLASNEQDQPPFSSIQTIDWPNYTAKKLTSATLQTLEIQASQSPTAENYYKWGLKLLSEKQFKSAQQAFKHAKDHDLLRFRAPSEFNNIIKQLSEQHSAILVDAEQAIRQDTAHGIINSQHMLEHLHPTIRGYFLIADAFVTQLIEHNLIDSRTDEVNAHANIAWQHVPVSQLDQAYGQFEIDKLVSDYPFTHQLKPVSKPIANNYFKQKLVERINGKDWLNIHSDLITHYQKNDDLTEASLIAGLLSDTLTHNHQAAYRAAQLYFKQKQFGLARFYYRKAIRLAPENINYQLNLAHCYFLLNEFEHSEQLLQNVLKMEPDHQKAPYFLKHVQQAKKANKDKI